MKWAIDKIFERHLINGWIAADDANNDKIYHVSIRTPEKLVYQAVANLDRPDVKSVNLHTSGLCGFSFNAQLSGIREGDLLLIELISEDKIERHTQSFLYHTNPNTVNQFDNLEIARDDFSIMEKETSSILKDYPHWIALKILLIRLRRNKRAKGWRGKFTGINYEHKETDWALFYYMISTFREAIIKNLSTRNLFSITDTIADFSTPLERSAAQSLSMFMFHERFAQTITPLCHLNEPMNIQPNTQHPIWGGMLSNRLTLDDALDVYLTRAMEVLQHSPLVLFFFKKIILQSMSEKNSIFFNNIENSDYFQNAWLFYKKMFERDLISSCKQIDV
ncbi:hypothetical protein [Leclercia adecarboxylata]|uniref:hypothetical protein n=1 Tax=Leclercia adecarboxylata TaxID=83655 RepID=UPI00384E5B94